MTWAFSLTTSCVGSPSSPLLLRRSISSISASGSTTTPFPMMHFLPGCRTPEGTRCSTVFTPPTTSVCPALAPPWKRTTTSAHEVKRSTTFPFPSSPHCAPTITTLDMRSSLSRCRAAAVHADAGRALQHGVVRRRFQVVRSVREEDGEEPAVLGELAPPHHARGRALELGYVRGKVEEQPARLSVLLPGAGNPRRIFVVGELVDDQRLRRHRLRRLGRPRLRRVRLLARSVEKRSQEQARKPVFHSATWCARRVVGSFRRRL